MKQTLLQMTQDILSSMSSDEVNSIGDTSESLQVANIIRQKYFDIINRVPLPEHYKLIQLNPSIDTTAPVLMYVPEGIAEVSWLKYYDSSSLTTSDTGFQHSLNVDVTSSGNTPAPPQGYIDIKIIDNFEFINRVTSFNPEETNVTSWDFAINSSGQSYKLMYKNDRQPEYCTVFNNYYIVFDAFDATIEDTLQASKTMALGRIIPSFQLVDSFIPDLAEEQFQLLFNEAKALAFFELKQQTHQLALQETQRGWSTVQKNKAIAQRPSYFDALPNFGRYGRGGWGVPRYFKLRGFDR